MTVAFKDGYTAGVPNLMIADYNRQLRGEPPLEVTSKQAAAPNILGVTKEGAELRVLIRLQKDRGAEKLAILESKNPAGRFKQICQCSTLQA
jgi:hypothetical protein